MGFITTQWLFETGVAGIYQGLVTLLAVGLPLAYGGYLFWLWNNKPDSQVTFIFPFFEEKEGKKYLVLSSQLTELAGTMLGPEACRLLEKLYSKTPPGQVIRFTSLKYKQAILAHLANCFWSARSSDGSLARYLQRPVVVIPVVICLVSTPQLSGKSTMGRKYRVLVVSRETLRNLPLATEVVDDTGKAHEWLTTLYQIQQVVTDEMAIQEPPYLSFELGDLVR